MIPIKQTIFGEPNGNCFAACIASLLEIPLNDVPNCQGEKNHYQTMNKFLKKKGFFLLEVWNKDLKELEFYFETEGYFVASGMSPRGLRHAVIYKGNEMVHDPHPSDEGLIEKIESIDGYSFLVPLNPSQLIVEKTNN